MIDREYHLGARSIDEEEQSVSSQTRLKPIKKSLRPLSGRGPRKSRNYSITERGESPTMELDLKNHTSSSSTTQATEQSLSSSSTSIRGMNRSLSNGRSKLRTRSRSRSRGRRSPAIQMTEGSSGGDTCQKTDLNVSLRRPRINSTSRIATEKTTMTSTSTTSTSSSTSASTMTMTSPQRDSSLSHPHHSAVSHAHQSTQSTPSSSVSSPATQPTTKSPPSIGRPKSPHLTVSRWR